MKDRGMHVDEDQILLSIVDGDDLSEDMKDHLTACPLCREKRTVLRCDLERLGEMAKEFTPLPRKGPVRPLSKPHRFPLRLPVFAAGFAVVLLIACLWGLSLFTDPSKQRMPPFSTEVKADLGLIDDIVEESAVPEYYLAIADADGYFDDRFLEFLVPLGEQGDSG
jgi:hypothetical protein